MWQNGHIVKQRQILSRIFYGTKKKKERTFLDDKNEIVRTIFKVELFF